MAERSEETYSPWAGLSALPPPPPLSAFGLRSDGSSAERVRPPGPLRALWRPARNRSRPRPSSLRSLGPPLTRQSAVVHFDVISAAQGSVLLELGATKVLCGIYGPREGGRGEAFSELGRLRVDAKLTSFARKHCRGAFGLGAEERHLAAAVTQALQPAVVLESFPKSVVDVYILLLDAHGSELQAAVMAASLALAHAGVHCRDLVTACGVALLRGSQAGCEASGALILDPTDDEIADATAAAVVTAMPCCDCVTHLGLQGGWAGDGGEEALEIGLEGCKSLDEGLRRALREETERGEARARHTAAAAVAAA